MKPRVKSETITTMAKIPSLILFTIHLSECLVDVVYDFMGGVRGEIDCFPVSSKGSVAHAGLA
jgi:hypothetical protein